MARQVTTTKDILENFDLIVSKLRTVLMQKNHDYTQGASKDSLKNFKISALVLSIDSGKGLLVRVMDKIMRITTYIEAGNLQVPNEGVDDAISDIIGYMVLLSSLLKEQQSKTHANIITVQQDGNQWVAHGEDFVNLQESISGWGDTPEIAISNYRSSRDEIKGD